ncbi:cytochrome c [Flavobacterium chungnamense]|uniref:Cytochrome c n=1 Tax=Flavobacterium chungnamense TaxID=706182 RepID=A0ABP7UTR1_9FLAO
MKTKILAVALLAIVLYSCGGSKSVPPPPPPPPLNITYKVPTVEAKQADSASDLAEGKSLYENNCAKCHSLYNPKDFSKESWKPILLDMQIKAGISDEQREKIYNYVISN